MAGTSRPGSQRGHKRSAPAERFARNSHPRYSGGYAQNNDSRPQTLSSKEPSGRAFDADHASRPTPHGFQSAQQKQPTRILAGPEEVTNAANAPTRPVSRGPRGAAANQQSRASHQPDQVPDMGNMVSAEVQTSLTRLLVNSHDPAMYGQLIESVVKDMCSEGPSQANKGKALEIFSFVTKHARANPETKRAVVTSLMQEWSKGMSEHISDIIETTGREISIGSMTLNPTCVEAHLAAIRVHNAAITNNVSAPEQERNGESVQSSGSSQVAHTITPYPFQVERRNNSGTQTVTLLLKVESKGAGRADQHTFNEHHIKRSIDGVVGGSTHSNRSWSFERHRQAEWLVHFASEALGKSLVDKSFKADGMDFRFEMCDMKLPQVFSCRKIPSGLSFDRLIISLLEARPEGGTYVAAGPGLMVLILDAPDDIKWIDVFTGKTGKSGPERIRFEVSNDKTACPKCKHYHSGFGRCPFLQPLRLSSGKAKKGLLDQPLQVV